MPSVYVFTATLLGHREPVEFTLWVTERMGDKAFSALKRKSQTIAPPFGKKEYEAELARLELIARRNKEKFAQVGLAVGVLI